MGILENFATVEIPGRDRLAESDVQLCESHQSAYEAAVEDFKVLLEKWKAACERQRQYLMENHTEIQFSPYLRMEKQITVDSLLRQLKNLDYVFMNQIIGVIRSRYHVTIDSEEIWQALSEPSEEQKADMGQTEQKENKRNFIRYEKIIEQILLQFSGRDFHEQAVFELKSQCRKAAKNYRGEPSYEERGNCLAFSYGASCSEWAGSPTWKLLDCMEKVLRGLAYYERGDFILPRSIAEIEQQYRLENSEFQFSDCEKIQSMKLYKNGRVDIRFRKGDFLNQFVADYLTDLQEEGKERDEV